MLDTLCSGKLIRQPELKTSSKNTAYTQFLLSVPTGDEQPTVVSGVAFGDVAERIAKLGKGDSLAVVGSLKPSEWDDKTTGEKRHGLSITVSQSLSAYDIKKRRKSDDTDTPRPQSAHHTAKANGYAPDNFNDQLPF